MVHLHFIEHKKYFSNTLLLREAYNYLLKSYAMA